MSDVEYGLFDNLCTLLHSKHRYFNYPWEYECENKGLEYTIAMSSFSSKISEISKI